MQCAMWWPRIPTLEDIQDDLGDFAEHLTAPPGQFYNIKDEVTPVASERATKSAARLFILLYICGVGGLVFLGLTQTTTELRLSPTLVEGWRCLMLRGYTGQQPMATLPLCSYGTEDAEFDVAFESATATFDQCVRLLRARGPAADPRWVSCSCDLGVQRASSQADCYACGDALKEYGWCNTGPTSPTSISNATLAALLNSTASYNSSGSAVPTTAAQQSCLYSLSVNIGGLPDLDFRDLHEDATGVAAFYSATPLTLSWYNDVCPAAADSRFAADIPAFVAGTADYRRMCSKFTNAGPYVCERQKARPLNDLLAMAFALTQVFYQLLVSVGGFVLRKVHSRASPDDYDDDDDDGEDDDEDSEDRSEVSSDTFV